MREKWLPTSTNTTTVDYYLVVMLFWVWVWVLALLVRGPCSGTTSERESRNDVQEDGVLGNPARRQSIQIYVSMCQGCTSSFKFKITMAGRPVRRQPNPAACGCLNSWRFCSNSDVEGPISECIISSIFHFHQNQPQQAKSTTCRRRRGNYCNCVWY